LFNSDTQGAHFTNAPSTGTIECRLAKLPLVAGNYYITVYVTVADAISDWISQAAQFSVEQGDYFGTGKIQSPGYGHIMVDHDWAIRGSNN
jgi:lipopolysaccharide transport system ATP-binding protein